MAKEKSSSTKSELERSRDALRKKALGYTTKEVVEEYGSVDGELSLVKRKVTTKDVPPDLSAIKAYIELSDGDGYSEMSVEDLERERERLIGELLSKRLEESQKN